MSKKALSDKVIVHVRVLREVLEPTGYDDDTDYRVISRQVVSEHEWVEDRAKALKHE